MTSSADLGDRARTGLAALLLLGLAIELAFHLRVAWGLAADYYDATDYLINARFLAGHGRWFEGVRPPLVSLLQMPFFLGGATAPWRGPHVLSTLLSYGALAACYGLFERSLSPLRALAATAVLAGSRLFVHYAPFLMADLLGMGLVAGALALHLAGRDRHTQGWGRQLGLAALCTGAIAARHPLAILGPFLLGFEVFESLRARRVTTSLRSVGFWVATVLPIPLFVALMLGLFHWRLGWDVAHGWRALAEVVTSQADKSGITTRVAESRLEYLDSVVTAFRWPAALLMLIGTFRGVIRGSCEDRANALWLVVNLALYSLVISRRESRYLLLAIPSAVCLAVRALSALEHALTPRPLAGGWRPRGVAALRAGLWVAVVAPLIPGIVTEATAFADPVYRDPFAQRVAERAAGALREPGRLLVVGDKYAVHPRRYRFTEGDEYYYFHHLAPRSFHYWLGRDVVPVTTPVPEDRWLRFPNLLGWAAPGDVIVVLESRTYQTRDQPARKWPLRIVRVWAARAERDPEGRCDTYRTARATLALCRRADGLEAAVSAGAPVEVYAPSGDAFESKGWFSPTGEDGDPGHRDAPPRSRWDGDAPRAVMLATYDVATAECPPNGSTREVADLAEGTWPGPANCPLLWRP